MTRIAQAGFKHIQWIHHWRQDFICAEPEIRHVEQLLKGLSLSLHDIPAPTGAEKNWYWLRLGPGNIGGMGIAHLESAKDRLISIHLHDNDGKTVQHRPVFTGTIDWNELLRIVAESPYDQFLTTETEMRRSGFDGEAVFFQRARDDGLRLLAIMRDHASGGVE